MIGDDNHLNPAPGARRPGEIAPNQDSLIEDKFRTELKKYNKSEDREISVISNNGTVVLSGVVKTTTQKGDAAQLAKRVPNVQKVVNHIEVNRKKAEHPTNVDPEILKRDCERLVQGQLLFEPTQTMRQGKAYTVFARLAYAQGGNITEGLGKSNFVIRNAKVSCLVALNLAAEEPDSFNIARIPVGRKDEQILEPDGFTEWDWQVTPTASGSLHLLLYVTPMLYIDGVGQGFKAVPQPPKVITVTPDRLFVVETFIEAHWAMLAAAISSLIAVITLLTPIRKTLMGALTRRKESKKTVGFRPRGK